MKIQRRRQVDGARFRLRFVSGEILDAKHPGVNAALIEAQSLVEQGQRLYVQVLDIDADDVLYTIRYEGKDVVTYAGSVEYAGVHAETGSTQRGLEAAV